MDNNWAAFNSAVNPAVGSRIELDRPIPDAGRFATIVFGLKDGKMTLLIHPDGTAARYTMDGPTATARKWRFATTTFPATNQSKEEAQMDLYPHAVRLKDGYRAMVQHAQDHEFGARPASDLILWEGEVLYTDIAETKTSPAITGHDQAIAAAQKVIDASLVEYVKAGVKAAKL